MNQQIQIYRDPKLEEVLKSIERFRFYYDKLQIIIEGYQGYRIGQLITVPFDDTFTTSNMNMYIIDILIEKAQNFALVLVPQNYDNVFEKSMNPLFKELDIADNMSVPVDSCFFAKHLGRDRFELQTDYVQAIQAGYYAPKLYKIHSTTFSKLKDFYSLIEDKENLCFEIKRIIERKKDDNS